MTSKQHLFNEFRHEGRLIYSWRQSRETVDVVVAAPPGARARDLRCDVSTMRLSLGVVGQRAYLEGSLCAPVKSEDCLWTLEDGELHLSLAKMEPGRAWPGLLLGQELDPLSYDAERKSLLLQSYAQQHGSQFDFSSAEVTGSFLPDTSAWRSPQAEG
jgi:hypothetical protein